jgi:hypothetical protein
VESAAQWFNATFLKKDSHEQSGVGKPLPLGASEQGAKGYVNKMRSFFKPGADTEADRNTSGIETPEFVEDILVDTEADFSTSSGDESESDDDKH